jgi:hypothetical protein
VSKVPLNAWDATAISFPDWMKWYDELDSERTGNAQVGLTENLDYRCEFVTYLASAVRTRTVMK